MSFFDFPNREIFKWSQQEVGQFIRIITLLWTSKLKTEVNNFLFNRKDRVPRLKHMKIKEALRLLGFPEKSKSVKIKFIRVVRSFPKKRDLALRFSEIIELTENNPNLNFFRQNPNCDEFIQRLHQQFDLLVSEISILVTSKGGIRERPDNYSNKMTRFQISNDFLYTPRITLPNPRHKIKKRNSLFIEKLPLPGMEIVSVWERTFWSQQNVSISISYISLLIR